MADEKSNIIKTAYVYAQNGAWTRVIEEYKKVLAVDPEDAQAFNMIGDAYARLQNDTESFGAYLKSRDIYEKEGNPSKVSTIERKMAKLSPEGLDSLRRRLHATLSRIQEAERLFAEEKFEPAAALFRQLIEEEPSNYSRREKLAQCLTEGGRLPEAVSEMKAIANFHLSEGRLDQAQVWAEKMSQLDPHGIGTLRLMAALAKQKKDSEQIIQYFGQLGQMAFDAGRLDEAKSAIEEAIKAGHEGLRPIYTKTLIALKQTKEAKEQLESAWKENPTDLNLLDQLLTFDEELGDWPSAYTRADVLLKHRPDDLALMERVARILSHLGKKTEAIQVYSLVMAGALKENKPEILLRSLEAILSLEPDNINGLKKKAEIYLKLGKKQEVIAVYKQLQTVFTQKKMAEDARKIGAVLSRLSNLKG